MKKFTIQTAALVFLAAATMSLAACSSGSATTVKQEDSAAAAPEGSADSDGTGLSGKTEEAAAEAAVLPASRKLVRTLDMDVETDSFDDYLSLITGQLKELGGYVEELNSSGRKSDFQNEQMPRSASITARIPADKMDQFLASAEGTANVISKSENTQDVTLQYSDLESRKKSLTIEEERIWALLEKAETLETVISLEERLTDIRYELESMESQLRLYDNQVDYSSVTIRISEVTTFTAPAPDSIGKRISTGFSKNLNSAAAVFINLFVLAAAGSPIWVPALIIIILIVFFYRKYDKKIDKSIKKKREKAPDKQEP